MQDGRVQREPGPAKDSETGESTGWKPFRSRPKTVRSLACRRQHRRNVLIRADLANDVCRGGYMEMQQTESLCPQAWNPLAPGSHCRKAASTSADFAAQQRSRPSTLHERILSCCHRIHRYVADCVMNTVSILLLLGQVKQNNKIYRVHLSVQITFKYPMCICKNVAPHQLHAVKANETKTPSP
jgi:hypothetical protein